MTVRDSKNYGYLFALMAAVLFGASTPAAKVLLADTNPWLLAGWLYFGSGIGLIIISAVRKLRRKSLSQEAPLQKKDWPWLGGAILFGGILGPVFLMTGLSRTSAASASLFLNMEGVLTAALAWIFFKEHVGRRIALGMILILSGGIVLSWMGAPSVPRLLGPLLITLACLSWAIDNNLTRKISASDPLQISTIKSLLAGSMNIGLAMLYGQHLPHPNALVAIGLVGLFGYGMSLICFILALRHIGTARTGAYFSTAPFVGAGFALIFLGDSLSLQFIAAGLLMGAGVWLHLTEHHSHEHDHECLAHNHHHRHDAHHQHEHKPGDPPGESHSHWHHHDHLKHAHAHYPDIHHRHSH